MAGEIAGEGNPGCQATNREKDKIWGRIKQQQVPDKESVRRESGCRQSTEERNLAINQAADPCASCSQRQFNLERPTFTRCLIVPMR